MVKTKLSICLPFYPRKSNLIFSSCLGQSLGIICVPSSVLAPSLPPSAYLQSFWRHCWLHFQSPLWTQALSPTSRKHQQRSLRIRPETYCLLQAGIISRLHYCNGLLGSPCLCPVVYLSVTFILLKLLRFHHYFTQSPSVLPPSVREIYHAIYSLLPLQHQGPHRPPSGKSTAGHKPTLGPWRLITHCNSSVKPVA